MTRGRYVKGDDINRVNQLARDSAECIAALTEELALEHDAHNDTMHAYRAQATWIAELEAAGAGLHDALTGMADRYAEMFDHLGLGAPGDSVAIQEAVAAVAAWQRATGERVGAS
jgi:hypothetical protein